MNKSKLITTTAIATVMTASAAQAELSISGGFAGWWYSADNATSLSRTWNTESVNVSYSDTMDNGMGVGLSMSVTATGIVTTKEGIGAIGGGAIGAALGGSLGVAGKIVGIGVALNGGIVLAGVGALVGFLGVKAFKKSIHEKAEQEKINQKNK